MKPLLFRNARAIRTTVLVRLRVTFIIVNLSSVTETEADVGSPSPASDISARSTISSATPEYPKLGVKDLKQADSILHGGNI